VERELLWRIEQREIQSARRDTRDYVLEWESRRTEAPVKTDTSKQSMSSVEAYIPVTIEKIPRTRSSQSIYSEVQKLEEYRDVRRISARMAKVVGVTLLVLALMLITMSHMSIIATILGNLYVLVGGFIVAPILTFILSDKEKPLYSLFASAMLLLEAFIEVELATHIFNAGELLMWLWAIVPTHEFLHAMAYWLYGCSAIPIPIMPVFSITIARCYGETPKFARITPILISVISFVIYCITRESSYGATATFNLAGMMFDFIKFSIE